MSPADKERIFTNEAPHIYTQGHTGIQYVPLDIAQDYNAQDYATPGSPRPTA